MDNKIDPLTGESTETPPGSQPEIITADSTEGVNSKGASELGSEEVAWNNQKGTAQDRFRAVLRERDEARTRAERAETYARNQVAAYTAQPQNQTLNPQSPDVVSAVQKLSDVGIATDEKVERIVNQRVGNLIYNMELQNLGDKYDGSDGSTPKFDRREYEDFVERNPQYQNYSPEDVFTMKMYPEEMMDAKYKANKGTKQSTSSLRPTPTKVREESLTPEFIERRLQQADGKQWYAENKPRINAALAAQPTSTE